MRKFTVMKIVLLTNYDFASLIAINFLMPQLTEHQILIGLSDKVGGNQKRPQALLDLAQYEHKLIQKIEGSSQPMLLSQLNHRFSAKKINSFEKLSHQCQTQIISMNDINETNGIDRLKDFKPDLILSIRFGKILQQPVIDIPRLGIINLHSGVLPDYQGVMATFWAMFNNDQLIGTSLHFISDKGIDKGEIIQKTQLPLDTTKSYLHNVLALYLSGCDNMVSAVNLLHAGQPLISHRQRGKSCYYGFPTEQDLDKFHQMEYQLFKENEFL